MGPSQEALPEIQQIVSRIARRMRRNSVLRSWSIEDLQQEVLRRLCQRWGKFDATRASEVAFAQVVAISVALMLLREARAQKRRLQLLTFTDLGGEPPPRRPRVPYSSADAGLDAATLIDLLDDPELRGLCILLAWDGPTQVARQTGRSRSVVYSCIERVRARAREGGFECEPAGARERCCC